MNKKSFALFLALIMVLSLSVFTACNPSDEEEENPSVSLYDPALDHEIILTDYPPRSRVGTITILDLNRLKQDWMALDWKKPENASAVISCFSGQTFVALDLVTVSDDTSTTVYFEDKDGNKRYEYIFIGNRVEFLSRVSNTTTEEKQAKKEPKNSELDDKVFEDFGNSIEIDDSELSF